MGQDRKDHLLAALVAIVSHAVVIGGLLWMQLSFAPPARTVEKEIWIPVGVDDEPWGNIPQREAPTIAEAASAAAAPSAPADAALRPATPRKPQPKAPAVTPTPRPTPIPARTTPTKEKPEPAPQPTAPTKQQVSDRVSGLFDRNKSHSSQSGTGSSTSGQGVAQQGSSGSSAGFALSGRSIRGNGGRPVMPGQVPDIRGTVVVEISVDASGTVIDAKQRLRGTNVSDARLIDAAVSAAKKTHFNEAPGAPIQKGTITYHFDVK